MENNTTMEETIVLRNEAYKNKDYRESDRLRSILDNNSIFIIDNPDGSHDIHYMKKGTTRKELESQLKRDRRGEALHKSWLTSTLSKKELK